MIKGRVWVLGDDIDTDLIYPGKYLPILDPHEMARHALEGYDPQFPSKLQPGNIIVAGRGFGCGSSREQAATSLKYAGVVAVVASSFARIFFRNAINQGLPAIQADIVHKVKEGEKITIDLERFRIVLANGEEVAFAPFDPTVQRILNAGGLVNAVRTQLKEATGRA